MVVVNKKIGFFFLMMPTMKKPSKLDFSGNVNLDNGNKGTILGVKGQSNDGNTKFVKVLCTGRSFI